MAEAEGRTLGLQEAADRTGLSVKTLRRRLKAGTLQGVLVQQNGQQVWRIPEAALPAQVDSRTDKDNVDGQGGQGRDTGSPDYVPALLAIIQAQQETIAALTEQVGQSKRLAGGQGLLQRLLSRG
jgi:hypothetical protein